MGKQLQIAHANAARASEPIAGATGIKAHRETTADRHEVTMAPPTRNLTTKSITALLERVFASAVYAQRMSPKADSRVRSDR
jgi:hypothetical protein